MTARDGQSEALLLEALADERTRRGAASCLLIGMQSCATVGGANRLLGAEHVALLHLDRSAGGVGCGLGNAEAFLSGRVVPESPSEPERYAVVGINVEAARNYRLLREIVGSLAARLAADGVVLAAGPKKGGAEVAATALREMFDSVTLLAYRKGHRAYRATGPRQPVCSSAAPTEGQAGPVIEQVTVRGIELRLQQDERIFARGRLDPATALLAGCFEVPAGAAVLDLGCGGGVLGILAALLAPTSTVTLADADPLAVEVSRQNASLNGVRNVTVHLSDVLRDVPAATYDVVLMNPPFHQGRTQDVGIAHRFIAEAAAVLRPGGRLYVVCNRFLRYEPVIVQHVGPVTEVAGDTRYKVLLGRRTVGAGGV